MVVGIVGLRILCRAAARDFALLGGREAPLASGSAQARWPGGRGITEEAHEAAHKAVVIRRPGDDADFISYIFFVKKGKKDRI